MALSIASTAFVDGGAIPRKYTCSGEDVSPPLTWSGAPPGTVAFALIGYGSPCPPPGPAHRYYFKLHALSAKLGLGPGASKQDVERAMDGRVLATAQLMGKFARQP